MEETGEPLEEDRYEVERIIDKRWRRTGGRAKPMVVEYKVRWKGYSSEHDTWEPLEYLDQFQPLLDD